MLKHLYRHFRQKYPIATNVSESYLNTIILVQSHEPI